MSHNYTSTIGNNAITDCFQLDLTGVNTSTMERGCHYSDYLLTQFFLAINCSDTWSRNPTGE